MDVNRVFVRKRKMEKDFGDVKLVITRYNVIQTVQHGGVMEVFVTQIYDVMDMWDFEDINSIAGEMLCTSNSR